MLGNLLDIAGSLLARNDQKKANAQNQANFVSSQKQAQGQFDSQMDESITRRVADAKNAGVHPLFALGASVGASPTLSSGNAPKVETGSGMGDALARVADRIGESSRNKAAAARDEAEAALLNSQRKRLESDFMSRGRDGSSVKTYPYGEKPVEGPIQFGPDSPRGKPTYFSPEIPQHGKNPGVVAGTRPGEVRVRLADGSEMNLYDPDLGLDEIGQVRYVFQRMLHYDRKASAWTKTQIKSAWQKAKKEFKSFKRAASGAPIR
ncbi:DNA pilot protein [Microviridae sp.]|nr:DNA pilot protein [Microviridae sp.]